MNAVTRFIRAIDRYQRAHRFPSFVYAVIKKYGDDSGSYQSAILTYYAVLSLFPLLIVFTTITQLFLHSHHTLHDRIVDGLNRYFPIIGNQLQESVHSPKKTGIALAVSLLVTLYGALGGANALRYSINALWHIPPAKRPSFLGGLFRSFSITLTAGLGFIVAAVLAGYTAILGHDLGVKGLNALVGSLVLWGTFIILFKLAIAGNKKIGEVVVAAGCTAVGIEILQIVGGTILAHELKSLSNMSDTFALVIALMFWLYLQAEVILYGVEIDVVRQSHLFPRSIQPPLTKADKKAYTSYVEGGRINHAESIRVKFHMEKE